MVPEKGGNIKKCQHLQNKKRTETSYCKKLAFSNNCPCGEKIKKICLNQYHKIS